MQTVRVDKGRLFPFGVSIIVTIGITFALIYLNELLSKNTFIWIVILLSPLVLLSWTSRKILEINPFTSTMTNFYWILGRRFMEKEKRFSKISKLEVINIGHEKYPAFREGLFAGYIELDDTQQIKLIHRGQEKPVIESMEKVARKLGVTLSKAY
jgi:hypothetical protein